MYNIEFYKLDEVENSKLLYAVIMAKYNEEWIFVRHKERDTWEVPGGHREVDEEINDTASRELFEETGAVDYELTPICIYSVDNSQGKSFGQLFYGEITKLDKLPDSEIGEVSFFKTLPENLTYPFIQPFLFEKVSSAIGAI